MKNSVINLNKFKNTISLAPPSNQIKRTLVGLFNQSQYFLNANQYSDAIDHTLTQSNPQAPHHLLYPKLEKDDKHSNSKPIQKRSVSYFNDEIYRGGFDELGQRVQWPSSGITSLSDRERLIRDALFGTDNDGAPGLEIVQESESQLKNKN